LKDNWAETLAEGHVHTWAETLAEVPTCNCAIFLEAKVSNDGVL
jgi:hypothetical protein